MYGLGGVESGVDADEFRASNRIGASPLMRYLRERALCQACYRVDGGLASLRATHVSLLRSANSLSPSTVPENTKASPGSRFELASDSSVACVSCKPVYLAGTRRKGR